jgi:hypothetical protein
MILWILPTLVASLSFISFLIHRRKYVGTTAMAIRQTWVLLQFILGIVFLPMRLSLWLKGKPEDIVLLWIIIPFILTGISMMVLESNDRRKFLDKRSVRLQRIMRLAFLPILLVVAVFPIIGLEIFLRNNPQWVRYFPILFITLLVIICICIVILSTVANRMILQKFKKKN